ncbi:hypothetical protein ACFRCW_18790 [Streptomyces sp. NPDC056653]|uniref:hypothetical protein n=1 Tax=Streptomyces sp. NPDC056653 TaxID=3345894 RepID=UPI0036CD3904
MALCRGSDSGRLASRAGIVAGGSRGVRAAIARCFVGRVLIPGILDEEGAALAAKLGDAVGYAHLDVGRRA